MPPRNNRAVVFIDGQNLYHLAKDAWGSGYHWPRYDAAKIANELVALEPSRVLVGLRFYTGVPTRIQNEHWHGFWTAKLRAMNGPGVHIYRGPIVGGQEKGVDVSIALDLVRLARQNRYDTAIVVSQDSDLNEALREVLEIARGQRRTIHLESAHPYESGNRNVSHRGLAPATWRYIDRAMYDRCVDTRDYRPASRGLRASIGDLTRNR